jgi:hypothetical protein
LLQTALPESCLLTQLEFAPYCTTVLDARLNAWPSLATVTQLESSLLSSASLSAADWTSDGAPDTAGDSMDASVPEGKAKLPEPLPPPPQPASAPAATRSRWARFSMFFTLNLLVDRDREKRSPCAAKGRKEME